MVAERGTLKCDARAQAIGLVPAIGDLYSEGWLRTFSEGCAMGKGLWLAGVASACVALFAATSRSDDQATPDQAPPIVDLSEPATVPLGQSPPRDPFTPYEAGPSEATWSYDDMSVADQEAANRGLDVDAWQGIHAGYAVGLRQRSVEISARLAQRRLGLHQLEIGVVP